MTIEIKSMIGKLTENIDTLRRTSFGKSSSDDRELIIARTAIDNLAIIIDVVNREVGYEESRKKEKEKQDDLIRYHGGDPNESTLDYY